jgi:hypothetical protein
MMSPPVSMPNFIGKKSRSKLDKTFSFSEPANPACGSFLLNRSASASSLL